MSAPVINASPTKEFYISIITKDISLLDAIKDLVDNCVDGARSLRGDGSYEGLFAHIEVKPDSFLIVDNCGGISVDTATNYAFRFGRAKGAPSIDGSIGQFGVGMKRALFKMGKKFEVKSVAKDSRFVLKVDVDQWTALMDAQGHEKWELEFAEASEGESIGPAVIFVIFIIFWLLSGVMGGLGRRGRGGRGLWWLLPLLLNGGGGGGGRGGGGWSGGGGGGFGGGGFSGGGGSGGGGGASGSW